MGGRFVDPPVPLPLVAAVVVALDCDDVIVDPTMDVGLERAEEVNDDGAKDDGEGLVEVVSANEVDAGAEAANVFDRDDGPTDGEVEMGAPVGELDGEVRAVTVIMPFKVVVGDDPDTVSVPLGLVLVALVVEVIIDSLGSDCEL